MSEYAQRIEDSGIGRWFRFREQGTTVARDTIAGMTTFIVMSYIIFVNPGILTSVDPAAIQRGEPLPFDGVLTSTCLVAGVMTILMGLYTNRAYAIAPGLGLNAVVAFTLVANEGLGYPEAMGLVVVEGLAVTLLVLVGLRESIMRAIPLELKKAIAIGIGLFIAFIGLVNSGLIVRGQGTIVDLAPFTSWVVLITLVGIVVTVALRAMGFPADLLLGIILTTVFATIVNYAADVYPEDSGYARWPGDVADAPNFGLLGEFSFDAFSTIPFVAALALAFSLFLADFFDTMGTLVGVGRQAGYLDESGELPDVGKPLLVDSLAAAAGGAASASSATTYIESASGVGAGGRTGWVSVVTGFLFFPFMFVAPLIGMVPPQATAPALIIVGWLMISVLTEVEEEAEVREGGAPAAHRPEPTVDRSPLPERRLAGIDFHDVAVGLSAAIVIMFMPFTFNITDGIAAGFIVYVLVRLFQRQWARVHPLMYGAAIAFALYFAIPILQQEFDWI